MKRFALLLLLGADPAPTQPLTFWHYAQAGDVEPVIAALECALGRWRAATCLPLDVSLDAPHLVRLADEEEIPGVGHTGGASWNETRIRLLAGMSAHSTCQVLAHELSHVLRRANSHPGLPSTISTSPTSMSQGHITYKDIDYVCAKQDCACDNPEPAPE